MSERTPNPIQDEEAWAMRVETTARAFEYPPTPDLTPAAQLAWRRQHRPMVVQRLAQAGLILLLIVLSMIATVPEMRAAVLEWLHLGAIEIFVGQSTLTPTLAIIAQTPGSTPVIDPTPLQSALDLPDEITLADARTRYPQMVRLPTYPPNLGQPDHVFDGPMLTFVWTEPNDPTRVRLVLGVLRTASTGAKFFPWEPEMTKVGDYPAYWSTEPHLLILFAQRVSGPDIQRQVSAHTLLWYADPLTFRLETDGDKAEAVQIAESLR